MLIAFLVAVVSSLFFYVDAFRSGLAAKKWAIAGFVFGPFILPMFSISQHVALRHARGFHNSYIKA